MTQTLLSQSEISRACNVPIPRVTNLIKSGALVPDFQAAAGRYTFFLPDRLPEIKKLFRKSKRSKAQPQPAQLAPPQPEPATTAP